MGESIQDHDCPPSSLSSDVMIHRRPASKGGARRNASDNNGEILLVSGGRRRSRARTRKSYKAEDDSELRDVIKQDVVGSLQKVKRSKTVISSESGWF